MLFISNTAKLGFFFLNISYKKYFLPILEIFQLSQSLS